MVCCSLSGEVWGIKITSAAEKGTAGRERGREGEEEKEEGKEAPFHAGLVRNCCSGPGRCLGSPRGRPSPAAAARVRCWGASPKRIDPSPPPPALLSCATVICEENLWRCKDIQGIDISVNVYYYFTMFYLSVCILGNVSAGEHWCCCVDGFFVSLFAFCLGCFCFSFSISPCILSSSALWKKTENYEVTTGRITLFKARLSERLYYLCHS